MDFDGDAGEPTLSADGLMLVFEAGPSGGEKTLYLSTRESLSSEWSAPLAQSSLANGTSLVAPVLSADGRTLWYGRADATGQIYRAEYSNPAFTNPQAVTVDGPDLGCELALSPQFVVTDPLAEDMILSQRGGCGSATRRATLAGDEIWQLTTERWPKPLDIGIDGEARSANKVHDYLFFDANPDDGSGSTSRVYLATDCGTGDWQNARMVLDYERDGGLLNLGEPWYHAGSETLYFSASAESSDDRDIYSVPFALPSLQDLGCP
ncbi:MAG: PD40 domain-containing protein [Deltaproteobacteria bacterium]|nr:PD40 domain-containing protein [Deltaproteobacteria bacterium]